MSTLYHPRTFFIVGIISLAVVVSFMLILGDAFGGSFLKSEADTDKGIAEQLSTGVVPEDPLVTVVPKDVVAGFPQPLPTDPKRGAKNPKVTIVEFGDFQCENCKAMDEVLRQVLTTYPNTVQHVWKDFPLPTQHQFAEPAAIAARCAQDQDKFWEMYDTLFSNQGFLGITSFSDLATEAGVVTDQFDSCMKSGVNKALVVQGYFVARSFDLTETPTFFINEQKVTGLQTLEDFKKIIDAQLAQ